MDLTALWNQLIGRPPDPGPVQAYTRTTHTPVTWDNLDTYGEYRPTTGQIAIDQQRLPQANPNPQFLSNVLRHEQVHALTPPESTQSLMNYFSAHPEQAKSGNAGISKLGYDIGGLTQFVLGEGDNKTLAQEAPAYAVQGYQFGMGDLIKQYLAALPPALRGKYMTLLGRYAPSEEK